MKVFPYRYQHYTQQHVRGHYYAYYNKRSWILGHGPFVPSKHEILPNSRHCILSCISRTRVAKWNQFWFSKISINYQSDYVYSNFFFWSIFESSKSRKIDLRKDVNHKQMNWELCVFHVSMQNLPRNILKVVWSRSGQVIGHNYKVTGHRSRNAWKMRDKHGFSMFFD